MKKYLLAVVILLIVGIGSISIYYFVNNKEQKPIHGTFINAGCENNEEQLHNLFQGTDKSYFI